MEKTGGDPTQGGEMCDWSAVERAADVGNKGEARGFDCPASSPSLGIDLPLVRSSRMRNQGIDPDKRPTFMEDSC
jgi:hypothetical protein